MLAACGRHDEPAPPPPPAPAWTCEPLPFAASTPIPEASGAAWVTFRGKPALFVISDSGNEGAFGIVDPDTGETLDQQAGRRSNYGDDYEGAAARLGEVWLVFSNGRLAHVSQTDDKFWISSPISPLGEPIADAEEAPGHGTQPPKGKGMVCGGMHAANCGRNFEGICLDDRSQYTKGPCAGFVASKADGHLYCLLEHAGERTTYTADYERSIAVTAPGQLADCAIGQDGSLWAGANIFGANTIYRVEGWEDPIHAKVETVGPYGVGNSEVLAVKDDVIYRMSDTNGSPSLMAKFRCRRTAR